MKKLYLCALCLMLLTQGYCQGKKKKTGFNKQNKENEVFLQKQWWLGFKAGVNLSDAKVVKSHSAISPTNYDMATIGKKYESFNKIGTQATVEITFYFKGISLSLQPTFRHSRFVYSNDYLWQDTDGENPQNRLEMKYEQEQKIDHADIPLIAKYEFQGDRIRPYLQGGIFSSFLINANKSVQISGVDYASGGTNEFRNEAIIVGATDLFAKNHWGYIAGAGAYYNLGNVRLNLDFQYTKGMSNLTSAKNRYGSDRLSGVGDTLDDIQLNNIAISLGCLFPLRFLGTGFKSLDH